MRKKRKEVSKEWKKKTSVIGMSLNLIFLPIISIGAPNSNGSKT
jgi:hypothetical protein